MRRHFTTSDAARDPADQQNQPAQSKQPYAPGLVRIVALSMDENFFSSMTGHFASDAARNPADQQTGSLRSDGGTRPSEKSYHYQLGKEYGREQIGFQAPGWAP